MARYSRLSSIRWAILLSIMLLSVEEVLLQVLNASCAASTARAKSSLVECAALVNTFPSMGETLSKYAPFTGATNFPPM
ncbi:hypothetical protein D3C85_1097850 [compost metagenome]